MGFQLGNLYVEKGQKTCGFLKLPFTEDELPVTLIYGREEGPTVLVDGGIHNAEYVGIECDNRQIYDEFHTEVDCKRCNRCNAKCINL